jgi:nitrile hydratase beta subunit
MKYRSHADLGGQPGDEPVVNEPVGEVFHAAWEARVLALTLAMGATGEWNLDRSRAARETLPDYIRLSYYEVWFEALLKLLAERGLVQPDEAAAGRSLHPPRPLARVLHAGEVEAALHRGSPTERPATPAARFAPGDRVRTRAGPVPHHTRLPGYVRGRIGTVEQVRGTHVFADTHAQGLGEQPQWLYSVAFDGAELWGAGSRGLVVSVDAWEPYLEAEMDHPRSAFGAPPSRGRLQRPGVARPRRPLGAPDSCDEVAGFRRGRLKCQQTPPPPPAWRPPR